MDSPWPSSGPCSRWGIERRAILSAIGEPNLLLALPVREHVVLALAVLFDIRLAPGFWRSVRFDLRSTVVLAYFLLMTAWIYGSADTGRDDVWLAPLVVLAQVALGFGVGRWWAPILPLALVLIAVPAGVPDSAEGEPLPLWFGLMFAEPFAVALVLIGVIARRLGGYLLARQGARGSQSAPGSAPPAASRR